MILKIIQKIFDWLFLLFSESQFASTRRVIGVASFCIMVFIGIFAVFKTVVVLTIVDKVLEYLFVLIMTIVVGATVTDTVKFTNNYSNKEEDRRDTTSENTNIDDTDSSKIT